MELFEEERGEATEGRNVWGCTKEAEGGRGGAAGDDSVEIGGESEGVEGAEGGHSEGGKGGGPIEREGAVPKGAGVAGTEVGGTGADEGGEGRAG